MKKVLVLAATVSTAAAFAAVPSAQAATCHVTWGSGAKSVSNLTHGSLTTVRAGRHACFDRLVLDDTRASGYRVGYVSAVRDQGRGAVVPLRGGAFLEIDVQDHAARRPALPVVTGFTTFRQVGWGGSFEGYTTVGLGVRGRLPFQVFRTPGHLIIDVAHRW